MFCSFQSRCINMYHESRFKYTFLYIENCENVDHIETQQCRVRQTLDSRSVVHIKQFVFLCRSFVHEFSSRFPEEPYFRLWLRNSIREYCVIIRGRHDLKTHINKLIKVRLAITDLPAQVRFEFPIWVPKI